MDPHSLQRHMDQLRGLDCCTCRMEQQGQLPGDLDHRATNKPFPDFRTRAFLGVDI